MLGVESLTYLGPARVSAATAGGVLLTVADKQILATMALPYPYETVDGDVVLAIASEDAWYVIGVLEGRGQSTFKAPADLKLVAPNGQIELIASKQVSIRGSAVQLNADRIELLATTIHETFLNAYRWVHQIFRLHAGYVQTQVRETYRVKAGRIVERAEGDVHIDGRKIHLG